MTSFIRVLNKGDTKNTIDLFKRAFKDDHIYKGLGIDTLINIPQDFIDSITYSINYGKSLGYFLNGELAGFLIGFDYYALKNHADAYKKVFGISDNSSVYGSELNNLFTEANNHDKLYYIMSIAVDESLRRQGIATSLVNWLINNTDYDLIGDVSSMISLPIYERQGFKISTIDDGYKLVVLNRHKK